ncbi:unnamed protein product [Caenorhabditis angaria]|uniref:Uncharacterized protein n=1 Tax=Caenorhabditis angaria TaxID=860376 RepID=A0A9P1INF3_9PELO|nr:unnamed protein product [Caenorhabditis angaria]
MRSVFVRWSEVHRHALVSEIGQIRAQSYFWIRIAHEKSIDEPPPPNFNMIQNGAPDNAGAENAAEVQPDAVEHQSGVLEEVTILMDTVLSTIIEETEPESSTNSGSAAEQSIDETNPEMPPIMMGMPTFSPEEFQTFLDSNPNLKERLANIPIMTGEQIAEEFQRMNWEEVVTESWVDDNSDELTTHQPNESTQIPLNSAENGGEFDDGESARNSTTFEEFDIDFEYPQVALQSNIDPMLSSTTHHEYFAEDVLAVGIDNEVDMDFVVTEEDVVEDMEIGTNEDSENDPNIQNGIIAQEGRTEDLADEMTEEFGDDEENRRILDGVERPALQQNDDILINVPRDDVIVEQPENLTNLSGNEQVVVVEGAPSERPHNIPKTNNPTREDALAFLKRLYAMMPCDPAVMNDDEMLINRETVDVVVAKPGNSENPAEEIGADVVEYDVDDLTPEKSGNALDESTTHQPVQDSKKSPNSSPKTSSIVDIDANIVPTNEEATENTRNDNEMMEETVDIGEYSEIFDENVEANEEVFEIEQNEQMEDRENDEDASRPRTSENRPSSLNSNDRIHQVRQSSSQSLRPTNDIDADMNIREPSATDEDFDGRTESNVSDDEDDEIKYRGMSAAQIGLKKYLKDCRRNKLSHDPFWFHDEEEKRRYEEKQERSRSAYDRDADEFDTRPRSPVSQSTVRASPPSSPKARTPSPSRVTSASSRSSRSSSPSEDSSSPASHHSSNIVNPDIYFEKNNVGECTMTISKKIFAGDIKIVIEADSIKAIGKLRDNLTIVSIDSDDCCGFETADSQTVSMERIIRRRLERAYVDYRGVRIPVQAFNALMAQDALAAFSDNDEDDDDDQFVTAPSTPSRPIRRPRKRSAAHLVAPITPPPPPKRSKPAPKSTRKARQPTVARPARSARIAAMKNVAPAPTPIAPATPPPRLAARLAARMAAQQNTNPVASTNPPTPPANHSNGLKRPAGALSSQPPPKMTKSDKEKEMQTIADVHQALKHIENGVNSESYGFHTLEILTRQRPLVRNMLSYFENPTPQKLAKQNMLPPTPIVKMSVCPYTNRFNAILNDYFNGFQHRSLANTTNFNFANEFGDIENNESQIAVDLDD